MDIIMPYPVAVVLGAKGLLELLQLAYPEFELFGISVDWQKSREYIAKARGTGGDIVIYWEP